MIHRVGANDKASEGCLCKSPAALVEGVEPLDLLAGGMAQAPSQEPLVAEVPPTRGAGQLALRESHCYVGMAPVLRGGMVAPSGLWPRDPAARSLWRRTSP